MTIPIHIVRYAAEECTRQRSGEMSVLWMCNAWNFAHCQQAISLTPSVGSVLTLGYCVEPSKNASGTRRVSVLVDGNLVAPWYEVEMRLARLMALLCDGNLDITPDEWYEEFEEIHPFVDGNGRVGSIVWNWLNGTLDNPTAPPNFWE